MFKVLRSMELRSPQWEGNSRCENKTELSCVSSFPVCSTTATQADAIKVVMLSYSNDFFRGTLTTMAGPGTWSSFSWSLELNSKKGARCTIQTGSRVAKDKKDSFELLTTFKHKFCHV